MIYEFRCDSCDHLFPSNLPIDDRNLPLSEPCPECGEKNVKREFDATSLCYDMIDVHTRAKRIAGSDWTDRLKQIHRSAGADPGRVDV